MSLTLSKSLFLPGPIFPYEKWGEVSGVICASIFDLVEI
jgi:hypothetical protein